MGKQRTTKNSVGGVFKLGVISLAFLVIGYEAALFVHRAAVLRIEAIRDHPDTVFVYRYADGGGEPAVESVPGARARDSVVRHDTSHSAAVQAVRRNTRRVETFRFNPNTVTVEDLMRLGFSEKQASAIDRYRCGGGRFRRKSDFAKSFVVSDSVFRRLEPFIDIPLVDINRADSAAFDALPGIGGWFAAKMVEYRESLGGYSCKEQLLEIYRFDRVKYDALSDLIMCSPPPQGFALWTLPVEELRRHPHIRSWSVARSIVLYRDNTPRELWTVSGLRDAGILDSLAAARLSRCLISAP